ncbi:MAG TPA: hypothetical protein VM261_14730 [Kofleriaceae bacterium]|nr:hypothetical protein [Kofleriaceae bacterium]
MRRAVAIMLVFLLCTAGCGLTQTRGPDPRQPPDQRPDCTETMDAPRRDSMGAVLGFVTILVGLLFLKADDNDTVGAPLIVGGAVVMAGSYVSGGVGYFRVKRCQRAITDWERRRQALPPGASPMQPY